MYICILIFDGELNGQIVPILPVEVYLIFPHTPPTPYMPHAL